jgi:hypothetical protein
VANAGVAAASSNSHSVPLTLAGVPLLGVSLHVPSGRYCRQSALPALSGLPSAKFA